MKITKLGHCCLLIEENGTRILTDPGAYTDAQNYLKNIDIVLITHEHSDHFHIESVKKILENNPGVSIITNMSVDMLLKKDNIDFGRVVAHGDSLLEKGINFSGFGHTHALIHKEWPAVENTGYFIADKLFYPGDAFYNPEKSVEILALPVSGPWMKISEAIDYAIEINPKKVFGVHDGMLNNFGGGVIKRVPTQILEKHGINFMNLELGKEYEF